MTKRAVTNASRKRGASNCLCCNLGSIKLRPVALRPRFYVSAAEVSVADDRKRERPNRGRALIRVSFTRDSARFAVRSPCFLEGAILDRRAGARTRHNRNFNRQHTLHTGLSPCWQGSFASWQHPRVERSVCSSSVNRSTP